MGHQTAVRNAKSAFFRAFSMRGLRGRLGEVSVSCNEKFYLWDNTPCKPLVSHRYHLLIVRIHICRPTFKHRPHIRHANNLSSHASRERVAFAWCHLIVLLRTIFTGKRTRTRKNDIVIWTSFRDEEYLPLFILLAIFEERIRMFPQEKVEALI